MHHGGTPRQGLSRRLSIPTPVDASAPPYEPGQPRKRSPAFGRVFQALAISTSPVTRNQRIQTQAPPKRGRGFGLFRTMARA